jgi:hypothetical protein
MKLADIERLIKRQPFQPFILQTDGGSSIEIEAAHQIAFSRQREDLLIAFDLSGGFWFLDPEHLALYSQ